MPINDLPYLLRCSVGINDARLALTFLEISLIKVIGFVCFHKSDSCHSWVSASLSTSSIISKLFSTNSVWSQLFSFSFSLIFSVSWEDFSTSLSFFFTDDEFSLTDNKDSDSTQDPLDLQKRSESCRVVGLRIYSTFYSYSWILLLLHVLTIDLLTP